MKNPALLVLNIPAAIFFGIVGALVIFFGAIVASVRWVWDWILPEDSLPGCSGDCCQGDYTCPTPTQCGLIKIVPASMSKTSERGHAALWPVVIIAVIAVIAALASADANAADSTDTAALSAAADGVSTVIAVGSGAGYEAGLVTNPPVFAAVAIAKVAVPYAVKDLPAEQRKPILQASAGVFGGAAANNMAVFVLAKAGVAAVGSLAALPVAIGLGVGYWLWNGTGEKFDAEQKALAAPEADAQLAMADQR